MRENGATPSPSNSVDTQSVPTPATTVLKTVVALPPGADPDVFDVWDDGSRVVWSHPMPLPEGMAGRWDIRVGVVQLADGTVVAEGSDQPVIYLNGDESKSVAGARALAVALNSAADLAELWAGGAR